MAEPIPNGTIIDEQFEVLAIIGSGNFGTVYRARQLAQGRDVAIKFLKKELLSDKSTFRRFEREARIVSRFNHPNVIACYGLKRWQGQIFMVQEFVAGFSLEQALAREKILSPARSLQIIRQICLGLSYAHEHQVLHRDLKPSNILLCDGQDEKESAKLIDFGLSKLLAGMPEITKLSTSTAMGVIVGTALYMSPEQCAGEKDLDFRTDIYSLGCILYECLTGVRPFDAQQPMTVMFKQMNEDAPRLCHVAPHLDKLPGLQAVIDRSLQKNRDERYQSTAELLAELDQLDHETMARMPAIAIDRGRAKGNVVSNETAGGTVCASVAIRPGWLNLCTPPYLAALGILVATAIAVIFCLKWL